MGCDGFMRGYKVLVKNKEENLNVKLSRVGREFEGRLSWIETQQECRRGER